VGPRTGLEGCGKSRPHRNLIPGSSSAYRFAIPTEILQTSLRTLTVFLNRGAFFFLCEVRIESQRVYIKCCVVVYRIVNTVCFLSTLFYPHEARTNFVQSIIYFALMKYPVRIAATTPGLRFVVAAVNSCTGITGCHLIYSISVFYHVLFVHYLLILLSDTI
jgi:hypothetical protein